jgi:hypothetical protein
MLEAWDPARVRARVRVEQDWIERGCVTRGEAVDVGRALFFRPFSLEEGFGNDLAGVEGTSAGDKPRPNVRRFQVGYFGGPDASGCFNCHWKGGDAGSGDRADNTFFLGDGEDGSLHDNRNPPALWGAGWTELIGREMTQELQQQAEALLAQARGSGEPASGPLWAKEVYFGELRAVPDGQGGATLATSGVEGVDADLVIKPFGWKGTFADLRGFVNHSVQVHMGLQSEELVAQAQQHTDARDDLGGGPNPSDPDHDGVERELTEGQVTSLVLFLATLDTPVPQPPTEGSILGRGITVDHPTGSAEEFAYRWIEGQVVFEEIGCAYCHTPFMRVRSPMYTTRAGLGGGVVEVDLSRDGAAPRPGQDRETGEWLVPVFSDFKRHDMGAWLRGNQEDAGVSPEVYLTRRLWGVANTRPFLHDASAILFSEAIAMHGGEGSEAVSQAQAYEALTPSEQASLQIFLYGLRRAPAIRIR